MKKVMALGFALAVLLAFSVNVYGITGKRKSYTITASGGSPIPTAADSANAQSLVVALTSNVEEVSCYNGTAGRLNVNVEDGSSGSAPTEADVVLEPLERRYFQRPLGGAIYIWSATGSTITALKVDCDIKLK